MKKVMGFTLLLCFIWTGKVLAYGQEQPKEQELYAGAACLMDGETGRVLYEKNGYDKKANASTTKILTCILALEQGNLQDTVTVSKRAARQPKVHLGAREGERFLLEDLLYSLMLESHNDSAVAIAEHIGGSVEGFAKLMNQKADAIGCENSYFITPNGLDERKEDKVHGTTAVDLARIMRYCIWESPRKEAFLAITGMPSYSFWNQQETTLYTCRNHNAFLAMMEGALSGKTGFTADAGYCYVGALKRDGKVLIVSLLACGWPNNKNYKWLDTKKLMTYGLETYERKDVLEKQLPTDTLTVLNGQHDGRLSDAASVPLTYGDFMEEKSLYLLLKEGEQVEKIVSLPTALTAPVQKGEKVGMISYRLEDIVLAQYPVYTASEVKKIDFSWCFDIIVHRYCMKQKT